MNVFGEIKHQLLYIHFMKHLFASLFFVFSLSIAVHAQSSEAQLLKEPASWTFERFNLPPVFAPHFPYSGAEELRFSPGMFNKDSTDYFTYAFVAQLNNRSSISKDDISNYLLSYFKGLCSSTARDRKLVVDTSKITVAVDRKPGVSSKEIIYNALLHVFGVFADGAAVQLNMEVKVLTDKTANQVYLIFITSPQAKSGDAWKPLYSIQQNFRLPAEKKKL